MEFLRKFLKVPTKETYFSSGSITHQQMFSELCEKVMIPSRYLGANIFDKDYYEFNFLILILTFGLLTSTFAINIYDIYLFRKSLVRCVVCFFIFTAAFQSYNKIYTFVFMKQNCIELKEKCESFHQNFRSAKSVEIFEMWMLRAAHVGFFITVMYTIVGVLISVYPMIFYFLLDERILHFGIEIPMLDWKNSWIAYGIKYIHQSTILIAFVTSSIPSISIVVIYISTAFAFFDILSVLLDELDQISIKNEGNKNDKAIKEMIKLITEHHMELIE